jgi:hypothetical protein
VTGRKKGITRFLKSLNRRYGKRALLPSAVVARSCEFANKQMQSVKRLGPYRRSYTRAYLFDNVREYSAPRLAKSHLLTMPALSHHWRSSVRATEFLIAAAKFSANTPSARYMIRNAGGRRPRRGYVDCVSRGSARGSTGGRGSAMLFSWSRGLMVSWSHGPSDK